MLDLTYPSLASRTNKSTSTRIQNTRETSRKYGKLSQNVHKMYKFYRKHDL